MNFKILTLKGSTARLLGLAGFGLFSFCLLSFATVSSWHKIQTRRITLKDLNSRINSAHAMARDISEQEQELDKARAGYAALENRIAAGQSVARILEQLSAQAKALRLELVVSQSREAIADEPSIISLKPDVRLQEIPLTLELTGRFRELAEFLGGLDQAAFIASVKQLRMAKLDSPGARLQCELELAVYLSEETTWQ